MSPAIEGLLILGIIVTGIGYIIFSLFQIPKLKWLLTGETKTRLSEIEKELSVTRSVGRFHKLHTTDVGDVHLMNEDLKVKPSYKVVIKCDKKKLSFVERHHNELNDLTLNELTECLETESVPA